VRSSGQYCNIKLQNKPTTTYVQIAHMAANLQSLTHTHKNQKCNNQQRMK
jgi:hypothetical protein